MCVIGPVREGYIVLYVNTSCECVHLYIYYSILNLENNSHHHSILPAPPIHLWVFYWCIWMSVSFLPPTWKLSQVEGAGNFPLPRLNWSSHTVLMTLWHNHSFDHSLCWYEFTHRFVSLFLTHWITQTLFPSDWWRELQLNIHTFFSLPSINPPPFVLFLFFSTPPLNHGIVKRLNLPLCESAGTLSEDDVENMTWPWA